MKRLLKLSVLPTLLVSLFSFSLLNSSSAVSTESVVEVKENIEVEKKEAVGDTGDIYLIVDSETSGSAGATFYAHMYGDVDTGWPGLKFEKSIGNSENHYVLKDVNLLNNRIQIMRMDSTGKTEWSRWNWFNTNDINLKTSNLFVDKGWMDIETLSTSSSSTVDIYAEVPETFTGDISVHAWDMANSTLGGLSTAWPGVQMTEVTDFKYHTENRIFRFNGDLNFTPDRIIISAPDATSTRQTKDLTITNIETFIEVLSTSTGTGTSRKHNANEFSDATSRMVSFDFIELFKTTARDVETSVCHLLDVANKAQLDTLVNSYNALASTVKADVDPVVDIEGVTIGETMTYLIAQSTSTEVSINNIFGSVSEMNIVIVIIASILLGAGVVGFYYMNSKKKKYN